MTLVVGVVVQGFFHTVHTVLDHGFALQSQQTKWQALLEIFSGLQTVSACIHKKIRPLFPLGGIAHHGVVAVETEQFEIGFEIHHGYSPITLRQ